MRSQGISMRFVTSALVSILLTVCFIIPVPAPAQVAGGTFTGTITDASGAVIPNAQVTIRNVATGVSVTTLANADGLYTAVNLLPGTYDVTISAPGFQTQVQSGITLTVGAQQVLNVTMQVGQQTQKVEVTGQAAAVQLATSSLSANVNSTTVRELPLNGRDWASLATLQPGVVTVRTHEQVTQPGGHARGIGAQMSIDGARPTQNSYRLNGIIVNDYSNAGPGSVLGQNLGVEAIQEFSVLTSNYSAEYGYTSGGVINAITRSGTNQFHGSAFEFLRNSSMDAANFFDNYGGLKKAPFRRNQFGGDIGGPIKKDKAFIFGDYEGLRQNKGLPLIAHTFSPNARLGILNDSNGNPLPPLVGACPYANSTNLAPGQAAVCVDNNIAKYFTFYPLPNAGLTGTGNTGNYAFSGAQVVPENYYTTRGDVKLTDKDNLNASWYYDHSTFSKPDALNQLIDGFIVMRQGASLEESHVFSPTMINTVRLGFNRSTVNGLDTLQAINPAAADPSLGGCPGCYAMRIVSLAGGAGVPGITDFKGGLNGQSIQNYIGQTFQVYDDALHTRGTHNLKFGGMVIRYQNNVYAPFSLNGAANFGSIANFLQNIPFKAQSNPILAGVTPHNMRTSIFAGYIQDDWKARPNLTVNLGLRYEMETIPTEVQNKIANLPTILSNPAGCVVGNCPNLNRFMFASNPTTKNFEPRVGFSWDPFHDGKTAVRGGFGIFDALPLPYQLIINNAQTSPFHVISQTTNPPQGSFPYGLAALFASPASSSLSWNYVEPNPKRNYVYQWNFNVQRQVTANTSVTLAYAGSRTIHNPFQTDELNTVFPYTTSAGYLFPNPIGSGCLPGPPDCTLTDQALGIPASFNANPTGVIPGLLINPNLAEIQSTIWQSKAWYNSFQAQVEKRMSHGVQLGVAFTWSKTMDTTSGSFAGDNFAGDLTPTLPWWNLNIIKGLSDFNVGRNLVINGLWTVPTPKSFGGPAGWIARGWQVGGVLSLADGVPVWPLDGIEGDPMGQLNSEPLAIPDRLCSNLINPGNVQYIKPGCLGNATAPSQAFYSAAPPFGCSQTFAYPTCINLLGNLGRNTVIGPGLANFDFSLVKDNHIPRISENFVIQFRAEFFNIFNRANFNPPTDNLEAFDATGAPVPGFGQLTSTQTDPRDIQLALKIIF
jgi:outer membrane receptor protein involved in Fe transport